MVATTATAASRVVEVEALELEGELEKKLLHVDCPALSLPSALLCAYAPRSSWLSSSSARLEVAERVSELRHAWDLQSTHESMHVSTHETFKRATL